MNLPTLDIPKDEAISKLREYEQLLAGERTEEDTAIAAGYRAASRGLAIIRLSEAIQAGGFHDNSLPRIAVVRADAQQCFAHWDGADMVYADDSLTAGGQSRANRGALVGAHTVRVPLTPPRGARAHTYRWNAAATTVPIIPPRHRPRLRRLRGFHILWEVESWSPVPPHDPALIRHIRGDLWAVLAVWDLTDLERAVLTQRARS